MCGFVAVFGEKAPLLTDQLTDQIQSSILYRGRDGQGHWFKDKIALFHSRLSIIDLNAGTQPMADSKNRFVISYNGEIYNHLELKKEYERLGAKFLTHSDTEVILEGFKLKKEKVLNDLNGMFSFVIWDKITKKLFIARDRLGKKPLFWAKINDTYVFSSTINSIKPLLRPLLNHQYFSQMTNIGASVDNSTIYKDIYSFPFASFSYLTDPNNTLKTQKYWHINFSKNQSSSLNDHLDEYDSLITDATRIRLRADVATCLTFSGGVDSGTIAAVIKKKLNRDISLFCIDYDQEGDRSEETAQAKAVAKALDMPLTFINYDYKNQILTDLQEVYKYFDQPNIQLPLVYSYILYKSISEHAKVTLSGAGADEIFTGYVGDESNYYKDMFYRLAHPFLKNTSLSFIPNVLTKGLVDSFTAFTQSNLNDNENTCSQLHHELQHAEVNSYYDLQIYMSLFYGARDTNFVLPDITGMANQVEVRSPFLDYRMVEFAARLPLKYKIKKHVMGTYTCKYLPKLYYERFVGKSIANIPKKGMGWNFKFQEEMFKNTDFISKFRASFQALPKYDIDANTALLNYNLGVDSFQRGTPDLSSADKAVKHFMLSSWLSSREEIPFVNE